MTTETNTAAGRVERARESLGRAGVEVLFVTPSADLRYLLGHAGHASERPTVLAIPRTGEPCIVVAGFEAPLVPVTDGLRVLPYGETEDPYRMLTQALGETIAGDAAISDQAWAAVLLHLQQSFTQLAFRPAGPVMTELRIRKDPEELRYLGEAGEMADAAFGHLVSAQFSGRTEREIAAELRDLLRDEGLGTSPWGPIVASGPNAASPHHIPGDRVVHEGDAVVLDFGGLVEGYSADITRTVHVGTPSDRFVEVYRVVRTAQEAAVQRVGPGVTAEAVDRAAREVIERAGYGDLFTHRTGHGIGLDGHEEPYIIAGNERPLEPGMTFSVEPGVYLPGEFGVRIEDIVAVTEAGADRLNNATRDLVTVR